MVSYYLVILSNYLETQGRFANICNNINMTLIAIKFNILFLIKNNITYNLIILANYPRNSLIRGVGFFFIFIFFWSNEKRFY